MSRRLIGWLYTSILCVIGAGFVFWGLSNAFTIVSTQTVDVEGSLGVQHYFTRLALTMPGLLIFALLFGALEYIAIGLLFFAFSTLRTKIAYWSCQISLWLLFASLWYQLAFVKQGGVYDSLWPFFLSPTSLLIPFGVTLLCSCILFAAAPFIQKGLQYLFRLISGSPAKRIAHS